MSTDSSRPPRGPLAIALLAAVVVTALAVVSLVRALETYQPLGFEARPAGAGWAVTSVSEEGTGLEPGDQILDAGGTLPATSLAEVLRQAPETELVVLRGGGLEELTYRRPPLDVDWTYLVLALIGTVYLLIGVYTLLRERRGEAMLFYLWCLASAAIYLFTPSGLADSVGRLLYAGEEVARALLPPLTLHLFLVFPRPIEGVVAVRRRSSVRPIPFLYLPAAALLTLQISLMLFAGRGIDPAAAARALPVLDRATMIHLVVFALAALGVLVYRLGGERAQRAQGREERRQLQWIAVGLGAGYVPFLLLYVLPYSFGLSLSGGITAAAVVPLGVVPLTFAWAILRYRLWDIAVVVRETTSTALTVILAGGAFALAHLAVSRGLPGDLGVVRDLLSFATGAVIAGMLVPTRRRLGSALERLHYGGATAKRRALRRLGRDLLHERDLERLASELLAELGEALEIEAVNLYLAEGGDTLVRVLPEPGAPERIDVGRLGEQIWRREVEALTGVSLATGEPDPRQRLFLSGYRYAFPLTVRDRPVGLLVSGYRLGEIPLSSEDLDLVRQLAGGAALAIENARLVDELEHRLDEVVELQLFSEGIIESSPAGIAVLDPEGRILIANGAFRRLVGAGTDGLAETPIRSLLPVEPLPSPGEGLMEVSYCEPDGTERHLQLSAAGFHPTEDDEDPDALRVLVVHDVSERIAMERALREKDRLAALGVLAAGVAHEVNTPLTGISSYAQMLLAETPESDPRHQVLKKVEKQTFRASRILNNLLEFARNRSEEWRDVDLGTVVEEALDLLAPRRSERGVELDLELPPEPVVVKGSEGELQQVITNLALNAIDAMPGGGTLSLGIAGEGEWAVLRVSDTGAGIPPAELDRIFEPVFSTKVDRGGTGLGLSISHDIVRRHGGEMEVESEPGRGTRFEVRLPRADDEGRDGGAEGRGALGEGSGARGTEDGPRR